MVKSKFTFFKMQVKRLFIHSFKFRYFDFSKSPKIFNPIDMIFYSSSLFSHSRESGNPDKTRTPKPDWYNPGQFLSASFSF